MMARRIGFSMVMVLLIAGNGRAGEPKKANPDGDAAAVVWGDNSFAVDLYRRQRGGEGNLFFSPYSISTALAMTYAGARGRTQEQMATVMHYPTSAETLQKLGVPAEPLTPERFAQAFGRIIKDLNARGGQAKCELRIANALWGQQGYEFLQAFTKSVEDQYGGKLQELDFVGATQQACRTINAWVEKQTNEKIKDLIRPDMLNAMTRLVLTNAIYFKGAWARPFDKDSTRDEPFFLLDGKPIRVAMMNQQAQFVYAEIDGAQPLEMPYVGGELSMVILLPKERNGLAALENDLTLENLNQWVDKAYGRNVIVAIPRFKMTQRCDLTGVLQTMGMTDAFSQQADFSGMNGRKDLFISAVVHQAYVDVNEEGTEAAAATGAVMTLTSARPDQPPVFRADHPFVFLIRDKTSGSILFVGRVVNPQT
jgi:serpin B